MILLTSVSSQSLGRAAIPLVASHDNPNAVRSKARIGRFVVDETGDCPQTQPPAKELVPPGWSQGNPRQTVLFVGERNPFRGNIAGHGSVYISVGPPKATIGGSTWDSSHGLWLD
jgi:hypothetical protein